MEINSHIIRLTGKAELPEALEIGNNYSVALSGGLVSATQSDNENGTCDITYVFRPVKIEILTPLGKSLQAKDPRSKSKLFRASLWKDWTDSKSEKPFEIWYDELMNKLIHNHSEISEMYG